MIAVFARPNHPHYKQTSGMMAGEDSGEWRYHGYVVVFVHCSNAKQVAKVQMKLLTEGLPEPYGHDYEQGWYGGRMDLIAVLPGRRLSEDVGGLWVPLRPNNLKQSIGDNRYAGFYEAKELLT